MSDSSVDSLLVVFIINFIKLRHHSSVSTLFIGLDVVSCVLICLVTLGIVLGLVDFHFLLSILCVLLILSRLLTATISVFFVLCCPVLLSFYLV